MSESRPNKAVTDEELIGSAYGNQRSVKTSGEEADSAEPDKPISGRRKT